MTVKLPKSNKCNDKKVAQVATSFRRHVIVAVQE